MKKTLLTILISGIIFTSIGATAAYVYTARDINYQPSDENWNVENVQEALTELKTDVNTITNKVEGIERVYKAGEVELVALVSDDSFYTDSNGKYVLSNSDTGRTLLADTSTYKSLASTEDCIGIFDADTVVPFKKFDYNDLIPIITNYNQNINVTNGHIYLICLNTFDTSGATTIEGHISGANILKNYGMAKSLDRSNSDFDRTFVFVAEANSNTITFNFYGDTRMYGLIIFDITDII